MFYFLYKTGFEFIALENVAVLHSPSEKTKASYQTKARNCFGTFSESTGGL